MGAEKKNEKGSTLLERLKKVVDCVKPQDSPTSTTNTTGTNQAGGRICSPGNNTIINCGGAVIAGAAVATVALGAVALYAMKGGAEGDNRDGNGNGAGPNEPSAAVPDSCLEVTEETKETEIISETEVKLDKQDCAKTTKRTKKTTVKHRKTTVVKQNGAAGKAKVSSNGESGNGDEARAEEMRLKILACI